MFNTTVFTFEEAVDSDDLYRIRTFFVSRPHLNSQSSELSPAQIHARRLAMAVHPSNGWRRTS
jgi:hypothetical protein